MKKLLTLALTVVMVLSMAVGCVTLKEDIATIEGDKKVSNDMAKVYLLSVKLSAEQQGAITYIDGVPNEDGSNIDYAPLKEETLEYMKRVVVGSYAATLNGIELTDEEVAEVETQATSIFQGFNTSNPDFMKDNEMTEEVFVEIIKDHKLAEKYAMSLAEDVEANTVVADEDIAEDLEMYKQMDPKFTYLVDNGVEGDVIRASHILIGNKNTETGAALTEEQLAAAKAKLEGILDRARNGEDFAELAKEYSEDPGSATNGGEYTFGHLDMVTEFEEVANSLNEGEISDVFETQFGYHIIKLHEKDIPVTEEVLNARLDYIEKIKSLATQNFLSIKVEEAIDAGINEYSFEVDEEAWNDLEL